MCMFLSKIEDNAKDGKLDQLSCMVEKLGKSVDRMERRIEDIAKGMLLAGMPATRASAAEIAEALGISDPTAAHIVGTIAMNDFGGLGKGL